MVRGLDFILQGKEEIEFGSQTGVMISGLSWVLGKHCAACEAGEWKLTERECVPDPGGGWGWAGAVWARRKVGRRVRAKRLWQQCRSLFAEVMRCSRAGGPVARRRRIPSPWRVR